MIDNHPKKWVKNNASNLAPSLLCSTSCQTPEPPSKCDVSDVEPLPNAASHGIRPMNFKEILMNGSFTAQISNLHRPIQELVDLIKSKAVTLEYIDNNPLYPKFSVAPDFLEFLSVPWQHSLIIKVLGISIGYRALQTRVEQLWKRKGTMTIIDLSNDYFLVKFDLWEDLDTVITKAMV